MMGWMCVVVGIPALRRQSQRDHCPAEFCSAMWSDRSFGRSRTGRRESAKAGANGVDHRPRRTTTLS